MTPNLMYIHETSCLTKDLIIIYKKAAYIRPLFYSMNELIPPQRAHVFHVNSDR